MKIYSFKAFFMFFVANKTLCCYICKIKRRKGNATIFYNFSIILLQKQDTKKHK